MVFPVAFKYHPRITNTSPVFFCSEYLLIYAVAIYLLFGVSIYIGINGKGSRAARWFVFKPKIPIWVNFGGP
jgi:hypothetical protein